MPTEDKMVEVRESELKALIAEVQGLRTEVKGVVEGGIGSGRVLRQITERTIVVRRIDGKAVIGFRNRGTATKPQTSYTIRDPKDPSKEVMYVDVILEGMNPEDAIPVNWAEFRNEAERVTCKVVKTEEKEWEIEQGMVKKKEVDGYSMVELDYDVPVLVKGKTRIFTVAMPDQGGRTVRIHEDFANM